MICVIMFFASYGAAISILAVRDTVKEYLRKLPVRPGDDKTGTPDTTSDNPDTPDDTHNEGFI